MAEKTETPKLRGRRQQVPLTLPPELVAELDARAEEAYLSRVKLIELLIREALARSPGQWRATHQPAPKRRSA